MKTRTATSFNYSRMPVKFRVRSNSGVTRTEEHMRSSASCIFLLILIPMEKFLKRLRKRLSKMSNNSLLGSHSSLAWGECGMYVMRISLMFWIRQMRSCIRRCACALTGITRVLASIKHGKSWAIYVSFKPTSYNYKHLCIVARNPYRTDDLSDSQNN